MRLPFSRKKTIHSYASEEKKFILAMTQIDRISSEAKTKQEKIALNDYAIRCIGRELAVMTSTAQLYGDRLPESTSFAIPCAYSAAGENIIEENRDLSDCIVICLPCEASKITRAAFDVFNYGFDQEKSFYDVVLYPEIRLAVVNSGRHHLAAASSMGTGSAKCTVLSLKGLFPILRTDGVYWHWDGGSKPVEDFRLAMLFLLARRIDSLKKPEPDKSAAELDEAAKEAAAKEREWNDWIGKQPEFVRWLYQRNRVLQQDNRLMAAELKKYHNEP